MQKPLPVGGYTAQPDDAVSMVNENKVLEEIVMRRIDQHAAFSTVYDQRMVALARTKAQEAFMWLNRAVFQPTRLSDDDIHAMGFVALQGEELEA